jgi:lipase
MSQQKSTVVAAEPSRSDPFHTMSEVSVPGGTLRVARAGPGPAEADAVVLAVHGVTASHMAFRSVARELVSRTGICVLAPDLRGRGRSAALPGPYGHAVNVTDLLAVLDEAGVERPLLAGHSSGAYAVALLAAEHPARAAAVVLLDGGLSFPLPPAQAGVFQKALDEVVEQWVGRLRTTYASVDQYVGLWRAHPALRNEWNDDVEAYARYDLVGEPGAMRSVIPEAVVAAECREVLDNAVRTAVERLRAPVYLVTAPRGMLDTDPVLPRPVVDAFAAAHPDAHVEEIPGINHYTLVLGATGPRRVAAVIEEAARHAVTS